MTTYVPELNEYIEIDWEIGDILDVVDHTQFCEAEGEDDQGRKYTGTIAIVDNNFGNGIPGDVEDVELK